VPTLASSRSFFSDFRNQLLCLLTECLLTNKVYILFYQNSVIEQKPVTIQEELKDR